MKTAVRKAPQFVVNEKGKHVAVLLDLKTYQRLITAEEELADQIAYDKAAPVARREYERGEHVTIQEYMRGRRTK